MTSGNIVAPFAQASELYFRKKKVNELLMQLAACDKIHLCNGASDLYSFGESRKELYARSSDQYPMYFGKKSGIKLPFKSSPTLNTTGHIKKSLLNAVTLTAASSNIFSASELIRLNDNKHFIRNEFQDSPLAATFSVYQHQPVLPKPEETHFFGHISTRLFVDHYATQHDLFTPTSVFSDPLLESFDLFPLFDVALNKILFSKLDASHLFDDTEFHKPYLNLIQAPDYPEFCELRLCFLVALTQSVGLEVGTVNPTYRLAAELKNISFPTPNNGQPVSALLLSEKLKRAMYCRADKDFHFSKAIEDFKSGKSAMKHILIFTATDLEDEVFRLQLLVDGFSFVESRSFAGFSATVHKNGSQQIEVWHVRTSAGSSGMNGSARIAELALGAIKPCYALSVGIAFGVDESKQSLGDVIVAEHVFAYEKQRVGHSDLKWRGDKIPCGSDVVSFSRIYENFKPSFRVLTGGVLSGDKLVDSADFLHELRQLDPTAIGGEMEGAGLAQACLAANVPFGLLKGICDFASGKNDNAQKKAASNAFRLAFDMLHQWRESRLFSS